MLEDLTIKDFALIDSDYLEFKKGFTVLSGETGAGKSILIGALSFLLGGKAETSQIRSGKSEASVSATFYIKDQPVRTGISLDDEAENACEWLVQHGIEIENNRVLLRRFIRDSGKSAAWIDNTPVTRSDLAQFSAFLLDFFCFFSGLTVSLVAVTAFCSIASASEFSVDFAMIAEVSG